MAEVICGLAERVVSGDRRAVGRAISLVEERHSAAVPLLRELFPHAGRALVIGVTGSPGAGKSTLVEKLAREYRSAGARVGIIAVDPTSPFSGGAILGDRIRMQALAGDEGVFIRSMATRGQLGGLASATYDAATVLDAAGYAVILIETVGVGQDEVDVARLADATLLLLVPGMGDDIQTFKAGVMEIADLYVINKADRPGVERTEQEVMALLSLASRADDWKPLVLSTVATDGQGIGPLREAIGRFRAFGEQTGAHARRRKEHWRVRLIEMLRQRLFEKAVAEAPRAAALDGLIEDLVAHRRDPYSLVDELVAGLGSQT